MHARELIEFAALLASGGTTILEHAPRLPNSGLEQFWSASRCRQDRWSGSLKTFSNALPSASTNEMKAQWKPICEVLEEILTTEVLTRIWGAICCGYEQQHGMAEASPIVRNVFSGHLESRHRALNLILHGRGLRLEEAVALNRVRRRSERWNDMLLGYLPDSIETSEFAFSPDRVKQFASDNASSVHSDAAWTMLLASLRLAYRGRNSMRSPNEDMNREVTAGILACLPNELFDLTGMTNSIWLLRMQHAAADTQAMIEQLIALEEASPSDLVTDDKTTQV